MAYKGRRRFDAVVIVGSALALGVVAAIAAAAGDTERIDRYSATADVGGRSADITEVIDYDFGSDDRHGIFRVVPGLSPNAQIEVSSASAPDEFTLNQYSFSNATYIRIGNPVRTIDGRHRYQISYPIDVEVENGTISWNAVGTDWDVPISNIELHLVAQNELTDLQCSKGRLGAWDGCTASQPEPGHLVVKVDKLDSREGITLTATRGAQLSATPVPIIDDGPDAPDPGTGVPLPAALAALLAIAAGGGASAFVRRKGKELVWAGGSADAAFGPQFDESYPVRLVDHDELSSLASTEFAPPKDLTAWQGGILFAERTTPDHLSAWLLERAIAGEIRIEGSDKDLTLHNLRVDSPEHESLERLFGGRSSVTLGTYDPQFATGWSALQDKLELWHDEAPFWDPSGDRNRRVARIVGFLLFLAGLIVLIPSAVISNRVGLSWLAGVAIGAGAAAAGFALLLRSWELRIRTPQGSGLWILVESFRRFINKSDAQHVEAAAKQGRLLEYTAWAVALDEADHWADALEQAKVANPDMYPTDAIFLAGVSSNLSRAAYVASTKPSSSGSSGGGGGGSVGSGGGGGGGGSW